MPPATSLAARLLCLVGALSMTSSCAGRRGGNTSMASNVSISDNGAEIATLSRGEYEVLEQATGKDATTSWFVLWFPVGGQRTARELEDGAYYNATQTQEDCDGMLLPHPRTKRIVVPLLLVNVVIKRTTMTGRCVRVKGDPEMRGEARQAEPEPASDPVALAEPVAVAEPTQIAEPVPAP